MSNASGQMVRGYLVPREVCCPMVLQSEIPCSSCFIQMPDVQFPWVCVSVYDLVKYLFYCSSMSLKIFFLVYLIQSFF